MTWDIDSDGLAWVGGNPIVCRRCHKHLPLGDRNMCVKCAEAMAGEETWDERLDRLANPNVADEERPLTVDAVKARAEEYAAELGGDDSYSRDADHIRDLLWCLGEAERMRLSLLTLRAAASCYLLHPTPADAEKLRALLADLDEEFGKLPGDEG